MTEAGIIPEGRNVELIDGEVFALSAKGNRHEMVRLGLTRRLRRVLPDHIDFHSEPGWRPGGGTYLEPDLLLTHPTRMPDLVSAAEALPVIEIADTTRSYDLKIKAPTCVPLDVRELWVIDADTLVTSVFREPGESSYQSRTEVAAEEALAATLNDGFSLRVADLGIEPDTV